MAALEQTWDALSIPFTLQIDRFLSLYPAQASLQAAPIETQLTVLSNLLKTPEYTLDIAKLFSPLLVDLCARWLDDEEQDELKFVAFGLLVPAYEELYPVLSQFLSRPSLSKGPLAFVTRENASQIPLKTLHILLLAYHRLLEACPHLHEEFGWRIIHLQSLCEPPHPDPGVRLLAIRCFARHVGMNEPARVEWEKKLVGTAEDVDPIIDSGFGENLDVWVLPVIDHKRFINQRNDFWKTFELCQGPPVLDPGVLSPRVACVGGVLMLKDSSATSVATPFVPTASILQSLQDISKLLSLRQPVLLSGPPSSGKSALITYFSSVLFPSKPTNLVNIHLADISLDARSLLGSFVSSVTNPGTFEWKDGVLIRAMKEGKVLVLENIDKASSEVLGTLWPLVESLSKTKPIGAHAAINVFGRETVRAKEGFTLFATRSVHPLPDGALPRATFLGHHKWMQITIPEPSDEDLELILSKKFQNLGMVAVRGILAAWKQLQGLESSQETLVARPCSVRDLMKWCKRIELTLSTPASEVMDVEVELTSSVALSDAIQNPVVREDVFLEARDIFFGSLNPSNAASLIEARAAIFAESLKIDQDRLRWLLENKTPNLQVSKTQDGHITHVTIERISLAASPALAWSSKPVTSRPFALHRPSLTLLATIAGCIEANEPALLTGETGTGKTTAVTYLADVLNRPLVSLNLSQQTESSDLLGGWKPVEARGPAQSLQERFLGLFSGTFSRDRNVKYEEAIRGALSAGKWKKLVALWKEAAKRAKDRIDQRDTVQSTQFAEEVPRKKRRLDSGLRVGKEEWNQFERDVIEFEKRHVIGKSKAIFEFVEGPLVNALRRGHWVLLDEINLATPETLEAISSILQDSTGSITLSEQGDLTPVSRHSNFRLFACMNPATDVGKKDLPPHIRSFFTETYVPPPDANRDALLSIVEQYIGGLALTDRPSIMDVAEFYATARKLADAGEIADGSNMKPHYSMRTLARALTFASDVARAFGLRRALWEGVLMAFSTVLEPKSAESIRGLAMKCLLGKAKNVSSLLAQVPPPPPDADQVSYVCIGPFWLERGPIEPLPVDHYILTPSVQRKLLDLARIITTRRFPVLIEGPTSSGKTSAIEYLARLTGHRFIRINNHEHTDIQEYLGTYVADPQTGLLVFQDGLLVTALRRGDWIVLDELNLAPTDVLEALNRLLDDNRELHITETGEVVKPHRNFMIFATQNPSGLYGGRKVLSRAFRNRFLEIHFQDVPQQELEQILRERCKIAPSYAKHIVAVFQELQTRRQTTRVFETKHGFATLRDLFRWAGRDAGSVQELAENGYMLIGERTRRDDDRRVVKEVIESIIKGTKINEKDIYNINDPLVINSLGCPVPTDPGVVWTSAMRRLYVLLARALRHNEPVLLVGETGSGKTSVCEMYAKTTGRRLRTLNCHQNTETADILGGQRPLRNRISLQEDRRRALSSILRSIISIDNMSEAELLEAIQARLKNSDEGETKTRLHKALQMLGRPLPLFEWQDGPLLLAMRDAQIFLLDEISLADDSVLERLNSVLEPSRTLVLAEKGGQENRVEVTASYGFQLVATMNPGGDYGKKELSPALRNRFTEIWVPPINRREDQLAIVRASWRHPALLPYSDLVVDFIQWVLKELNDELAFGLRDLLTWTAFSARMHESTHISPEEIFHHAAYMVVIDGLATLPQTQGWTSEAINNLRQKAVSVLNEMVPISPMAPHTKLERTVETVRAGPFAIPCGALKSTSVPFEFNAPTTLENAKRVIRACQLSKPVLLEGSPGVGKTSLVTALASICCQKLCRVNLSDQTDLMDLFGSDLPVEGGSPGEFAWKDAAFLQALQQGDWVLLDEMNLASQSVLEGLNAILDHRGTVFLPELGRTFVRHPNFRIFAAQNPTQQGGGRKGLPKSFVNRFTKVYMQGLTDDDLFIIAKSMYPHANEDSLRRMIQMNTQIHDMTTIQRSIGRQGAPWEFNLRDVLRWLTLMNSPSGLEVHPEAPTEFIGEIYLQRLRTRNDRDIVTTIAHDALCTLSQDVSATVYSVSATHTQIGHSLIERKLAWRSELHPAPMLQKHLRPAEVIAKCIEKGWLVILVGDMGAGKTTLLEQLASFHGAKVVEFYANSATDTTDLLGSFEQEDDLFRSRVWLSDLHQTVQEASRHSPFSIPDSFEGERLWHTHPETILHLLESIPHCQQKHQLSERYALLRSSETRGRFAWVDGPLTTALKDGSWFLLENANLCNPSVLDRLNSLCELGGTLALTERGLVNGEVEILKPHPRFRIFMTMDPVNGELSRAMRNRGIEIHLESISQAEDHIRTALSRRRPTPLLPGPLLPELEDHSALRSVQLLLRLWPRFVHLPADTQISFISQWLPKASYALIQRLSDLSSLAEELSFFVASHNSLFCLLLSYANILGLPPQFLETLSPEPRLNGNVLSRVKQVGLYSEAVSNSLRRDLALVLLRGDKRIAATNNGVIGVSREASCANGAFLNVPEEIKVVHPILQACRNVLETVISTSIPLDENNVFSALADLWESTCEVMQQSTLDYSLWIASLRKMEQLMCAVEHRELRDLISRALRSLRLRSGLEMTKIWDYHFRYQSGEQRGLKLLQQLGITSQGTPMDMLVGQLHAEAYNAAALSMLDSEYSSDLMALKPTQVESGTHMVTSEVTSILLALQLGVMGSIAHQRPVDTTLLSQFCDLMLELPSLQFSSLSMRALKWNPKENHGAAGLLSHAISSWMSSIWQVQSQGAKLLSEASVLLSSMELCTKRRRPIASIARYSRDLRVALSIVTLESCLLYHNRGQDLAQLFLNDLFTALEAILGDSQISSGPLNDADFKKKLLLILPGHSFIYPLKSELADSYSRMACATEDLHRVVEAAKGWIYLGLLMLHLFIPNFPLDPRAESVHEKQRLLKASQDLEEEISLHRHSEALVSGQLDNDMTIYLEKKLHHKQLQLQALPPSNNERRDVIQLQDLISELLQFHDHILDLDRMKSVIMGLAVSEEQAINRESVSQESWGKLIERIQTKYSSMGDIVYPVVFWTNRIRFGTSLLRNAHPPHDNGEQTSFNALLEAITTFPSPARALRLMEVSQPPAVVHPAEWSSLRILAIISHMTIGEPIILHQQPLSHAFDQVFGLWLHEQEKRKIEEQEGSSLYKKRKTVETTKSEEELEAEELRTLFPEYGDVLDEDRSASMGWKERGSVDTSPYQMFHQLFSPTSHIHLHQSTFNAPLFAIYQWMGAANCKLDPNLDSTSVVFRMNSILQQSRELQESPQSGYNFYKDSNVPQARKAMEILDELNQYLLRLFQDWPEQMVLLHLSERCQAIMQLDMKSPLSRILSAMEQLLVHTDDWQQVASKDVSIAPHQLSLSNLIIEWRRLELACWARLLDAETHSYSDTVDEWWYKLYHAIIHASREAMEEDKQTTYISSLLPLIEGYLTNSTLGQFGPRLQLLRMFATYLSTTLVVSTDRQPLLRRVCSTLHSIVQLYGRFDTKVRTELSNRRNEVDNELASIVKLASWKDVNVLALKADAQRTHQRLYRCIRKLRAMLKEPVSPVLSELEVQEHCNALASPVPPTFASSVPLLAKSERPNHLSRLNDTLEAFHEKACKLSPRIIGLNLTSLDDQANSILSSINVLQQQSHPLNAKEQPRIAKNLMMRRRRALADLLKACKTSGLSPQIKPETQARHTDRSWLIEHRQVILPVTGASEDMDLWFDKILWTIPRFQASIASHAEDVSTRDLTKLLNYVHGILDLAIESRQIVQCNTEISRQIHNILEALENNNNHHSVYLVGSKASLFVAKHLSLLCFTISSAQEIVEFTTEYPRHSSEAKIFDPSVITTLRNQIAKMISEKQEITALYDRVSHNDISILFSSERESLVKAIEQAKATIFTLKEWCIKDPRARHLCDAFLQSFDGKLLDLQALPLRHNDITDEPPERPIDRMLIALQRLSTLQPFTWTDQFIKDGAKHCRKLSDNLDIPRVWHELQSFVSALQASQNSEILLQRLHPFLQRFHYLAQEHISQVIRWTIWLFKLASQMIDVGQDLADRGFGKSNESNEEAGKTEEGNKIEGTGVGEGMGDQNVSSQIEDESQIEGVQGEETAPQGEHEERDDETLEVDQKMDGDLESVDGQESNEEASDSSEDEMEEQMENLDAGDPEVVDEKMWERNDEKEGKKDEMKSNQKSKEESNREEMGAKESEENRHQDAEQTQEEAIQDVESMGDDIGEPEEGPDVENLPNDAGLPIDEQAKEEEILDLPQELKVDDGEEGAEGENDERDDGEEMGDEEEIGEIKGSNMDEDDVDVQNEKDLDEVMSSTAQSEDETERDGENVQNTTIAEADESQGQEQKGIGGGHSASLETGEPQQAIEDAMDMEDRDIQERAETIPTQGTRKEAVEHEAGKDGNGPVAEGVEGIKDTALSPKQVKRSLAEAFAEVQRRYQEILENIKDSERSAPLDAAEPQALQHAEEGEENTKAAFENANQDEVARLRDLNIVDDTVDISQNEDVEMKGTQETTLNPPVEPQVKAENVDVDHMGKENLDPALTRQDIRTIHEPMRPSNVDATPTIPAQEQASFTSQEVEAQLIAWRHSVNRYEGADSIWRMYSTLTHELAWSLCEQLRLILEPTKATRLRGDYRTGKRLNMKKIIPYIASEYTKDKIWLRRTRPSQREYQILLALDDSRSMSESHSEHLAFETLALVSKALTRLEAGDISVVKFGESVEVLHGFDDGPFNDAAGAKAIGSLKFDQTSTDVLSLVETSMQVLQNARDKRSGSSSSASNLWQLEIIISDGICSDHDKLRAILRSARERRILVVFVIIDALSGKTFGAGKVASNSIVEMKQVREDLTFVRYLDIFPFEYYVVLRSVDALPEVLAGTLKQFFERIAEE